MKDIFLLDSDDTLMDFRRAEREALTATLRAFEIDSSEDVVRRFHAINDGLWKRLECGETTRERLRSERFEILFAELRCAADAGEVAKFYLSRMAEQDQLIDGAEAFLDILTQRGRIFIVTNGMAQIQRSRLSRTRIARYPFALFISDEIGCTKPSPAFADYVEARIPDYDRSRAVWIGDSLTSDCACAKSKGIDFILFSPDGAPRGYEGRTARNFKEALALIFGRESSKNFF